MNQILVGGTWTESDSAGRFSPYEPATGRTLAEEFPVSSWDDVEAALEGATRAVDLLRTTRDAALAEFLRAYGEAIEARRETLVETAHMETALPSTPRLEGELTRTVDQLNQAADAVLEGSWVNPIIDTASNIRSMFGPLRKPVVVFGPNNFPFAFNGISGGDFAAAIAAGNPVIVKGHPGHPITTRILAEAAVEAMSGTDVPDTLVSLLYHMDPESGLSLVSDGRVGAVAFTGSQRGGLALKAAADAAGTPIYLEMGSINPVFVLDGALNERGSEVANEFYASCTLGTGQFCTNPGLVIVPEGAAGDAFTSEAAELFAGGEDGLLLGPADPVAEGVDTLLGAGAQPIAGAGSSEGPGFRYPNTLLTISAKEFLADPQTLQREVFGPVSLIVRAADADEMASIAQTLEGNLTGSLYANAADEDGYRTVEAALRPRVGRLLNDKMPTGVAVVASMNHGGPYPATGHPGFTAVGMPTSIHRFAALYAYDNVSQERLPEPLRDANPNGRMWRYIDGTWTRDDIV